MSADLPTSQSAAARRLLPLIVVVLTGFMAVGLPLAALPLQVHGALGFDAVTVGYTIGIQSVATVLTRGMSGRLVDTRGPKVAVILGLPAAALAGAAYALSASMQNPGVSLAILLVGRACLGLAESLFLTGTMSWGIARVGPARTGLVMSWQGIAMYAALGFGAPLGLAVMDRFGFMGIAACTVALPLIGLAVALTLPSVAPVPAVRAPFLRVVGLIWRQGVVLALSSAPFAAMATFLTLDYAARGWSGAGFALLGFSAGYIGVRLFLAHLPDKIGGAAVAVASLAVEIAGQLCLWAAPTPLLALVGTTVTGLGFSLMFPAMGVDALRRVSPENRGLAVGGFIAFFDIAIGATAPLAGFLVAPFGLRSVFLAGAAACLCAFVLSLRLRRGEGRG